MAEIYNWLSTHFLEAFGLGCAILHGLWFLLKHLQPVLEEGRARYLYLKSWWKPQDQLTSQSVEKAQPPRTG